MDGLGDSQDFVRGASQGDRGAVAALLERHLADLRRYVERRAGRAVLDKESGSDLVQSVCRELFEGLEAERFEYRGEQEFKQWLYAAALFKLQIRRRHWRTEKRDSEREKPIGARDSTGEAGPEPLVSTTPSVEAVQREDVARLRAGLDALPEHYREIIELAHVQGLSHKEISKRLSIEEGHSRVLLTRALARLSVLATRKRR
jgi:RNA polymerase sigma-70 factor, ECF subfamily